MYFLFENITISGGIATGKNTLKDILHKSLEPYGWKATSGGQLLRDFTKEYINPLASLADDDFHHKLDERTRTILTQEKNYIIEAWLAGFVARDLDNTLRVLLICSDQEMRAKRVMKRDTISKQEAERYISQRENDNFVEWKRLYGDYEFWNPKYYHLLIDTAIHTADEVAQNVLATLGK